MRIIRKSTEKLLIESFKKEFKKMADEKESIGKRLSFVLTGGPSPKNLYKQLSKLKINWSNIDFFWGDERYVAKNSINSNYYLANKNLLKIIRAKKNNIYSVNTNMKNAKKSAINYSNKIKKYFKRKYINFSIFLLGMGDDGHIASIFPDDLDDKSNKISRNIMREDFERITINLKTINKSKKIYVWLNSKKKTNIFNYILKNKNKSIPVNSLKKSNITVFSIK